jgi:hypothetical protein
MQSSDDQRMTSQQALDAMRRFLEAYWRRGGTEEIAILLSALEKQADGFPADQALLADWNECVAAVLEHDE